MRPIFFWCAVSYLLLIPALTMRAFAEEARTGSIELLYTLPVTEGEMVLGKYLASLALMSLALLLARRLVRDLGPVVRPAADQMAVRHAEAPQGRAVGAQPVGRDRFGHAMMAGGKPWRA